MQAHVSGPEMQGLNPIPSAGGSVPGLIAMQQWCAEDIWSCKRPESLSLGPAQQLPVCDGQLQDAWFSNYVWQGLLTQPPCSPVLFLLLPLVHTLYLYLFGFPSCSLLKQRLFGSQIVSSAPVLTLQSAECPWDALTPACPLSQLYEVLSVSEPSSLQNQNGPGW